MSVEAIIKPNSLQSLACLTPWLSDNTVSEIVCQRPQEIFVERNGKMEAFAVPELTERRLKHTAQLIANENQQIIGEKAPLLSGSLPDGSRIQWVRPPVAKYDVFAIRRQVVKRLTLEDYNQSDFFEKAQRDKIYANQDIQLQTKKGDAYVNDENQLVNLYQQQNWYAFIKLAIALKKTIVISGGTSTGKTTFLNACLQEISKEERIITLEDTREVEPPHLNQVNLIAPKGEQGMAKITMQDCVQCALRLRPDRIICGEIRGKEILDFVSACSTGHEGSFTTIHANNPNMAFMRMVQMVKLNNVPSMTDSDILNQLKAVIDIIIQLHKTPEGRRIHSVYFNPYPLEEKPHENVKPSRCVRLRRTRPHHPRTGRLYGRPF